MKNFTEKPNGRWKLNYVLKDEAVLRLLEFLIDRGRRQYGSRRLTLSAENGTNGDSYLQVRNEDRKDMFLCINRHRIDGVSKALWEVYMDPMVAKFLNQIDSDMMSIVREYSTEPLELNCE